MKGEPPKSKLCKYIMIFRWHDESKTKSTKFLALFVSLFGKLLASDKNSLTRLTDKKCNIVLQRHFQNPVKHLK